MLLLWREFSECLALAAYCGSKYAMLGFSESLYHELHGTGVGITVVSPIAVKTNFFNNESFGGQNAKLCRICP